MKQTLLGALLASALITPAYCDAITINEPHGGTISGNLMTGDTPAPGWHWVIPYFTQAQFIGFAGPGFWGGAPGSATNYAPGNDIGYIYNSPIGGKPFYFEHAVADPNGAGSPTFDPFVGTVSIDTPVTISDSSGDRTTYDILWSGLNLGVALTALYGVDDPMIGVVLAGLDVFVATYEPGKNATISGVSNMVSGIISAGLTSMGASSVPIGPDPTADFNFWIMNTEFNGTFDYYGNLNDISGIHDLSLFVDGTPVSGSNNVPEASTWLLMTIGFSGLAFVATRRQCRIA